MAQDYTDLLPKDKDGKPLFVPTAAPCPHCGGEVYAKEYDQLLRVCIRCGRDPFSNSIFPVCWLGLPF